MTTYRKIFLKKLTCSLILVFIFLITLTGYAEVKPPVSGEKVNLSIIPFPSKIEKKVGFFVLTNKIEIKTDPTERITGEQLATFLRPATGYALLVNEGMNGDGIILKTSTELKTLGEEGYRLAVSPSKIEITAFKSAGLFYGVQTLRQLLPAESFSSTLVAGTEWKVPCVDIEDVPRFSFRGMMLDTGHDFQTKQTILRYLDLISLHKFNVFHWHITDLGTWPLEIKKYPKLLDPSTRAPGVKQGHFTQEEVREIIEYARKLHITVVPEVDMPSHVLPVLVAYPELDCPDNEKSNPNGQFCVGNEEVFTFCENVLSEVCDLFPSSYVHIGADEVRAPQWATCWQCKILKNKLRFKIEKELENYFIRRMADFLKSKGKKMIGWDEIVQDGLELPSNAVVMAWHGQKKGILAAQKGHEVIMSPNMACYFSHGQTTNPNEINGKACMMVIKDGKNTNSRPMTGTYAFDPTMGMHELAGKILGGVGHMWTDMHPAADDIDAFVFPRAAALSEVLWTPMELKDYSNFLDRLQIHFRRLDLLGVHYFGSAKFPNVESKAK